MLALEKLTRAEKLQMMEALWDDLTHGQEAGFPSPAWHGQVLQKTEQQVAAGQATFIDWESAKQALRNGKA